MATKPTYEELQQRAKELEKRAFECKQIEEMLEESEEKYRRLVDNANEAIFVARDGVLQFANPKTIEITGYSQDELLSMRFTDLCHPEDREGAKAYLVPPRVPVASTSQTMASTRSSLTRVFTTSFPAMKSARGGLSR